MCPQHRYPPEMIFGLLMAGVFGGRRDFRRDASLCTAGLNPPLSILGADHIPQRGLLLVVINHYSRPGMPVWWPCMALSSLLPMPHTWITASQWTAEGRWYEPLKSAVSLFLFERLASVYGFLRMPPMPPRSHEVEARAGAVREALDYVERDPQAVICLAPEGRDIPGGALGWPPSGAGRFMSLLAKGGVRILPAAAWEAGEWLTLRFGPPFTLQDAHLDIPAEPGLSRSAARDRAVSAAVMQRIACLLPEPMRGEFA